MRRTNFLSFLILVSILLLVLPLAVGAATVYEPNTSATAYVQLVYYNGTPENSGVVTFSLRASNETLLINGAAMSYVAGSDGLYKYDYTTPGIEGIYTEEMDCTSPSIFGQTIMTMQVAVGGIGANITQDDIDDIAGGVTNSSISGLDNTGTLGGALNNLFSNFGGDNMLLVAIVGLIIFFAIQAYKTKALHWAIASSAAWWGLTYWIFFSGADFFTLTDIYVQIFTTVFVLVSFIPLIDYMNHSNKTEIRMSKGGKSWTELDTRPGSGAQTGAERRAAHRKELRRRIGGK